MYRRNEHVINIRYTIINKKKIIQFFLANKIQLNYFIVNFLFRKNIKYLIRKKKFIEYNILLMP